LPWCPAGPAQAARDRFARAQAFAVRFLAAGFFIGAFFFAAVFFAAALAIVFSLFCLARPNQFRNIVIMSKRRYFVDREQRFPRGMDKLSERGVASSPQISRFQVSGIRFQERSAKLSL
jgi:hypothetical protein